MGTLPLQDLAAFAVDPESVKLLGYGFCKRKQIVVLGVVDPDARTPVTVGMVDPDDVTLCKTLQQYLRREVEPVRLTAADILKALEIGHGRWEAPEGQAVLELRPGAGIEVPAGDDPLQAALVDLLRRAVVRGATAVHVVSGPESVEVRARLGGVLQPVPSPLSPDNVAAFVSRWKTLAGLDADTAAPQRGRVELTVADEAGARNLLLHVATLPGRHGEDLTVRIEGGTLPAIELPGLGLLGPQVDALRSALRLAEGLVVLCGPPGCGRTTTLYACLDELQPQARRVLTAEDPVARRLPYVGQRQLGVDGSLADTVRAFIDHDADVVAIDPLRGRDAVAAAVELGAAQQLLLAVRTATGPASALALLVEDGAPPTWLADATTVVVHQRLVRRACPHCSTPVPPTPFAQAVERRLGRPLPAHRPVGCEACHGTGYNGRLGLFELLPVDRHTAPLLAAGRGPTEIRAAARAAGMVSIFDVGISYVEARTTTLDELQRVTPSRIVGEAL